MSFLLPVAATLDSDLVLRLTQLSARHRSVVWQVRAPAPTQPVPWKSLHLVPRPCPPLAHSRAGIIASGTATVEAAMMETPFVMVYRVTPLTYLLGRSTVKVPHFAMVNLIAGEEVVPELVQKDFAPERVVAEIKRIIPDGEPRQKMLAGLHKVRDLLQGDGQDMHPADRAAQAVVGLLRR